MTVFELFSSFELRFFEQHGVFVAGADFERRFVVLFEVLIARARTTYQWTQEVTNEHDINGPPKENQQRASSTLKSTTKRRSKSAPATKTPCCSKKRSSKDENSSKTVMSRSLFTS